MFIVGIGASAGGLEALEKFFCNCPPDTGAAFVVIQHLSAEHKSMMADLLARHTSMPVQLAENNLAVQANRVYLIPPGKILHFKKGHLLLENKQPHVLTLPVDIFFQDLARDQGNQCLAVILSGTGSDGTRGIHAIHAAGGLLLAQDPEDARFDGMPRSSLQTGLMDAVHSAEELGKRLPEYLKVAHATLQEETAPEKKTDVPTAATRWPVDNIRSDRPGATLSPSFEENLEALFHLLQQSAGINFRSYKRATVQRRLERRIQLLQLDGLATYLNYLQEKPSELATLRKDLLISVTSFFRDADSFAWLQQEILTPLVQELHEQNKSLRLWTAGVSTGEEAYSLALLLLEIYERLELPARFKIFATDVNQRNIEQASQGCYPESIATEINPERLARFFDVAEQGFSIKPWVRPYIVFAQHNLLTDPPFTRMDLTICRNTLIYFNPVTQAEVLSRLIYALNPQGYLFLGSSESIGDFTSHLVTKSEKHKIFQRSSSSHQLSLTAHSERLPYTPISKKDALLIHKAPANQAQATELSSIGRSLELLVEQYSPPALLVNEQQAILHFFGQVQPYLNLSAGDAKMTLARLLLKPLLPVAAALLYKAIKDSIPLVSDYVELTPAADSQPGQQVRLLAYPLPPEAGQEEKLALLCFELPRVQARERKLLNMDTEAQDRIRQLEGELAATRESLQSTIEELETSNEELQATNEELRASNEELQSSNEELQSLNEELNTVNFEYQEKVGLLNRLYAELDTMSRSLGIPSIFVDEKMRVTRFTRDVNRYFRLQDSDLGRPLSDLNHDFATTDILEHFKQALIGRQASEHKITTRAGAVLLLRVQAFKLDGQTTLGAVGSFIDISTLLTPPAEEKKHEKRS